MPSAIVPMPSGCGCRCKDVPMIAGGDDPVLDHPRCCVHQPQCGGMACPVVAGNVEDAHQLAVGCKDGAAAQVRKPLRSR